MNVSPRSDGTIPDDQQQVLRAIGKWLRQNGEGIYGTRPYKTAIEKNIRFTQAPSPSGKAGEGTVYAFVLRWDGKPFTIKSLDVSKVKSIISLADGKKIRFKNRADGIFVEADGSATNNAVGFKIVMK